MNSKIKWPVSLSAQYFIAIILLLGIGVIMVYSSSAIFSDRVWGNEKRFFWRQLFFIGIGAFFLFLGALYPYRKYSDLSIYLMVLAFLLMVIVLIPGIGVKVSGARRWIRFFGIGIQPAEFLKISAILWAAGFLDRKKEYLQHFSRSIVPSMLILSCYLILLLLQPDFGTAVLLSLSILFIAFASGVKVFHVLVTLILVAGSSIALVYGNAYRMRRITAFMDPWADPNDSGYQLINSLISFGSGGWVGRGLGNSLQKQYFLPQAHTDFIFAIIGEETGFIGVITIIALYIWMIFTGFKISLNSEDNFGKNIAFGISILFTLQTILHMCVVVGLLPTKGIGLPFVSYGGSSIVSSMFLCGVMINITQNQKIKPQRALKQKKQ